jgi:hypothetical protein
MVKTIRNSLCIAASLTATLLCAPTAHGADDKPKAATSTVAAKKSASSPQAAATQGKSVVGEKSGSAAPGSMDTGKGGNTTGFKKPSPPKVPQDAAATKKAAVQQ